MRVQKQSSASRSRTQDKNNSFGLFGSLLKRITTRRRKREIEGEGIDVSVKDILRWDSSVGRRTSTESKKKIQKKAVAEEDKNATDISACEISCSCSYNGRPSSAFWSESNEDRSLDMDFSSSSQSVDSEVIEFFSKRREDSDFASRDKHFCGSPFRFVLQSSPSSGRRTPEFPSPAGSPSRDNREEKETGGAGSLKSLQEAEEKEQCSPVSVLDPLFDEGHEDEDADEEEGDSFDHERSYALVQRAKLQLLNKLRRFEKLAGLDPIELEKRMLEQDEDDNYDGNADCPDDEEACDDEPETSNREESLDGFVMEVLSKSRFHNIRRIPEDMKRLISDLIVEEGREQNSGNREEVVHRVCKRLELWKEVESNTIDMMVEQDFRKELDGWMRNQEQIGETALDIELAVFGLLVQELSEELVSLGGN